jgi:L-seryl-tRNA(Ser) seleniumtransferase
MDHLLEAAGTMGLMGLFGSEAVKAALEEVLEEARKVWRSGGPTPGREPLLARCQELLKDRFPPPLRRVINATGVVLHTNLGRAPLCGEHLREAAILLAGYVDLEMDVASGTRGHRDTRIERSFQELLGTRHALVAVNNNAAALLLALHTLARGRDAVVSRGELVEIGGGFRIHEVGSASGARLKEVGATNRTHISDYAAAIAPDTAILLKVHPANFRIRGYAREVPLEDLVALGRERSIPVVMDLGSGLLAPEGALDLGDEPSVRECLAAGPDVLCFSADKLLGASQAGIILVRPDLAPSFRNNPLLRALRVDKVTCFLLGRALEAYRRGDWRVLPALGSLAAPLSTLMRQARALARGVEAAAPGRFTVRATLQEGRVGGGTAPLHPMPSPALSIQPEKGSANELETFLRSGDPPAMGVLHDGSLHLHTRTLLPGDGAALIRRIAAYPIRGGAP